MAGREEEPQTWHYGIVARWWAEFNVDGPEIAYFQKFIEDYGQPALDVACGTGRLLVPYLRAGLDVDGCDLSADMLALCRERAEAEGLSPALYVRAMHELQLPRTYKTIHMPSPASGLFGRRMNGRRCPSRGSSSGTAIGGRAPTEWNTSCAAASSSSTL